MVKNEKNMLANEFFFFYFFFYDKILSYTKQDYCPKKKKKVTLEIILMTLHLTIKRGYNIGDQ